MTVAGFETPERGRIVIGGRDMTRVPPHRRGLGMVFQRYALFPHMSVHDNVAYPLHRRGVRGAELAQQVGSALDLVHLAGLGARMPDQLSGGQQQRVALARALVFRPPVLLMDEPLGALDRKLRDELQIEIKQIQRALGTTVMFVTHDQAEALQMADQIAVLNHGQIEQQGPPASLYDTPDTAFIADFLGEANLFSGTLEPGLLRLADGTALPGEVVGPVRHGAGRLAVRPGRVRLHAGPSAAEGVQGIVVDTVFAGETTAVILRLASGERLIARMPAPEGRAFARNTAVQAGWAAHEARIFAET